MPQPSSCWIQAQAPLTAGVVVIVRCFSISALSAGSTGKWMITDWAIPTTSPSPGEMVLSASSLAGSVENVPLMATCLPSVPTAVPVAV